MNIIKSSIMTLAAVCAVSAFAQTSTLEISSVTPVPGSVISQFNYTRISLAVPSDVAAFEQTGDISYQVISYGDNAAVSPGYPIEAVKNRAGEILIQFTADAAGDLQDAGKWPVNDPGQYVIDIPAGALTVTSSDGSVYTNEALTFIYDLLADVAYTAVPEAGSIVAEFSEIRLQFPEFSAMRILEDYSDRLVNANGTEVSLAEPQAVENILIIPVADAPFSEIGDYTFTLGERSLDFDSNEYKTGQVNPFISYTFNCVGNQTAVIKKIGPTPGPVELLSAVNITYSKVPHINRECKEELKVYLNDELIYQMPNTSYRVKGALDNDDPGLISYAFCGSVKDFYRTPGLYRVEIPEAFVCFGEGDFITYSEALSLEYVIQKKISYNADPRPGSLESISEVTLTFNDVADIIDHNLQPDENGDGGISFTSNNIETDFPTVTVSGNSVTFKLSQTYSTPDSYMLYVPFGAFTFITTDGEELESETMRLIYTIDRFPAPLATPEPGEYDYLREMTFTLAEGLEYNVWLQPVSLKQVLPTGELGAKIGEWDRGMNADGKGLESARGKTAITLYPKAEYDLAPGLYAFIVGKSSFAVTVADGYPYGEGFNNCDIYYYYTIIPSTATEMTPQYDNGHEFIGTISSFEIYFEQARTVELIDGADAPTIATSDGNDVNTNVILTELEDRAGLTIHFTPEIIYNGEYVVTIPAGVVRLNDKLNPRYELTYSLSGGLSGVESALADASRVTVYGIDGSVVLRNAEPEAVKALSAGLYIVNGKKMIVR